MGTLIALFIIGIIFFLMLSKKESSPVVSVNESITSHRLRVTGEIDRIKKIDGFLIPVEIKKSRKVWPSHIYQTFVYALLIEEKYKKRPPYIIIELSGENKEANQKQYNFTEKEAKDTLALIEKVRKVKIWLRERAAKDEKSLIEEAISRFSPEAKISRSKCDACSFSDSCPFKKYFFPKDKLS